MEAKSSPSKGFLLMEKPACASKRDVLELATLQYFKKLRTLQNLSILKTNFVSVDGLGITWSYNSNSRKYLYYSNVRICISTHFWYYFTHGQPNLRGQGRFCLIEIKPNKPMSMSKLHNPTARVSKREEARYVRTTAPKLAFLS